MTASVRTLAFRLVNAYLLESETGFVLIDTGFRTDRSRLYKELVAAGCLPGDLKLIVITHGDPDHSANAAHLRATYGAKIAMHRAEAPAVERGDMFLSRGSMSFSRRLLKPLMSLFGLRKRDRFAPDVFLDDGDALADYGLNASVLHVPGHSVGSIAVLTVEGALFSGDFFENRSHPSIATFVDDALALKAGYERVKDMRIHTVYPGHGKPFALNEIA